MVRKQGKKVSRKVRENRKRLVVLVEGKKSEEGLQVRAKKDKGKREE